MSQRPLSFVWPCLTAVSMVFRSSFSRHFMNMEMRVTEGENESNQVAPNISKCLTLNQQTKHNKQLFPDDTRT